MDSAMELVKGFEAGKNFKFQLHRDFQPLD